MAKGTTGSGLSFTARLNTEEATKKSKAFLEELRKLKKEAGISNFSIGPDTKPLTAYQQELLKIKQAAAEAAAANRSASLATQEALQKERLELIEINKERAKNMLLQQQERIAEKENAVQAAVKRPTVFSDSQAEIDAYNNVAQGAKEITSTLNEQNLAQAALANSATASGKAIAETDVIEKKAGLTKKQQAFLLAEEKYNQQQATKELKNNVREMNNAKGSLEQRRAALIRLQTVFDRMSAAERESPAGGRLQGVLSRLNDQVLSLEKSTGRSQRNVGNYLTKAWGGLKLIAGALPGVGLAGLLGFAIEPIVNYLSQLDLFKKKVTEATITSDVLNRSLAGSEYTTAIKNVAELKDNIKLAKDGFLDKDKVLKQYNTTLGSTLGYADSLNAAEKHLIEQGAAYIEMTQLKAAAQLALSDAAKKAFEAEQQHYKSNDDALTFFDKLAIQFDPRAIGSLNNIREDDIKKQGEKRRKEAYTALKKDSDQNLKVYEDLQKKAAELAKKNKLDFFDGTQDPGKPKTAAVDTELNARNALQKKIDEMNRGAVIKAEDADQKEIDSVKEKYVQIRKEVDAFYAEQKKKGKTNYKVDVSGLSASEKKETDAVRYKQEAKKQLESLDLQKKQYAEYEQFRNDFGEEMAQKRFGKEIIDNKTYLKKLKDEAAKIEAVPVDQRTGAQKDQLTELNKRIAVETDAERVKYDTLLKQLQSYQDQAKILTENYVKDQAEIAKNPLNLNADQLAEQYKVLKEKFDKNISALSVSELTNSIDWSNLFSNLDDLAASDIETLLNTIEGKFKDLSKTLTPIDLATTRKKLQEARDVLIKDNPFRQVGLAVQAIFSDGADGAKKSAAEIHADWINLARATEGAFKFVSDAVDSCEILKDAIGEVGTTALSSLSAIARAGIATATAVSAASQAASATAVATSAAIKAAEKASVILAVISLALVVVQGIASVFKSIFAAGDKRIEKTIQGYQDQLKALDKGFQQLERDVQRSVGESFYTDSLKEIENLNQQQALLQRQLDAERSKKHADQGKIDTYQASLDEIPNKIQDIQQSITDMLVQTTFKDLSSSLADAFTSAFASGEDSLAKLNEAFNNVIANAVKKGLELKFLQPVVDGFIKDFAAYMNSNGNSAIGFDFTKYKDMLQVAGDSFTAGLEPFKEFFKTPDSSGSSSALNNSIKSITSDQANALEGIQRGTYDLTKQNVSLATIRNTLLTGIGKSIGDIYNIAVANLANNAQTAANTANTVVELQKSNKALADIVKNTASGSTRGSGLGI